MRSRPGDVEILFLVRTYVRVLRGKRKEKKKKKKKKK